MNMDDMTILNRRAMMQRALLLLGATAVPVDVALAAKPKKRAATRFLTPARYAILMAVADTIVPKTDTPGAIASGVPARLDGMLLRWASADSKTQVQGALDRINAASLAANKKAFTALTPAERLALLKTHDAAALKSTPPPPGAPKVSFFSPVSYVVDPGYLKLKGLVINLHYASEIAGTQELVYEHNPGPYVASMKATPATRPWASFGPF
jgi:gluconate 2-dehydrogenase gamma chain